MTETTENTSHDLLVGYFASVAVALVVSSFLAGALADQLVRFSPAYATPIWHSALAAGLFIAISYCNPVGTYISKGSLSRAVLRLGIGFVAGLALQILFIAPVAGTGMSQIILLLVAGLAVPVAAMFRQIRTLIQGQELVPTERVSNTLLRVVSWPDRIQFVVLMGISFFLFWRFAETPNQIMWVLAGVLIALTLWVTMRQVPDMYAGTDPEEAERRAWLELDPVDDTSGPVGAIVNRLKTLGHRVLPGAILFAGVTRLAVDFLLVVYPDLSIDIADPVAAAQSIGIVAASGLGVIFFGMMAALGFCLLLTQLIGRIKGWSAAHLRENYVQLIRAMYFRPMDQA